MDRLNEEVEKRGAEEAPYLTQLPSEYIKSGRIFFGIECGEKTIPDAVRWQLDHTLLYSSDYPHWDGDWPHMVKVVRDRSDLSDDTKRCTITSRAFITLRLQCEFRRCRFSLSTSRKVKTIFKYVS